MEVQKRYRETLEGPRGHLWGRGWPWTACGPCGPEAAVLPPPASAAATLLQPECLQLPPHFACREKKRRGWVSEESDAVYKQKGSYSLCASVWWGLCEDTSSNWTLCFIFYVMDKFKASSKMAFCVQLMFSL